MRDELETSRPKLEEFEADLAAKVSQQAHTRSAGAKKRLRGSIC